MAIHLQPGDEMNLPLARAVIGGLAVSTLLTLVVVPVLYSLLESRTDRPEPNPGASLVQRANALNPVPRPTRPVLGRP